MERIIKWFISNTVAANMLMFIILVAGTLTLPRLKMEVFPDIDIDAVTITVPYPGSSPSDVEEGICFLIEENLQGLKGVKRITSLAAENLGITTVEFLPGEDVNQIQDKIKSRIDAIDNFPGDAEKPIIQNITQTSDVITVAISGDVPEESLISISDRIKDEIDALPGITYTTLVGKKNREIEIEISEKTLRKYGLSLEQISRSINSWSIDLPVSYTHLTLPTKRIV